MLIRLNYDTIKLDCETSSMWVWATSPPHHLLWTWINWVDVEPWYYEILTTLIWKYNLIEHGYEEITISNIFPLNYFCKIFSKSTATSYKIQTPKLSLWNSENSLDKGFQNLSTSWPSNLQNSTLLSLQFTSSQIKWYLVSICLLF